MVSRPSDRSLRFPPPPEFAAKAHIKSMEQYQEMYARSITDPDGFGWSRHARWIGSGSQPSDASTPGTRKAVLLSTSSMRTES
jgi:hypothetical protein